MDLNAIKSGRFSDSDYEKLRETIEQLQTSFKYLKVDKTAVLKKNEERFFKEVDREFHKLAKKQWRQAKKKFLLSPHLNADTKSELNDDIERSVQEGDYAAAFSYIGSDVFDKGKLWDKAFSRVQKRREEKYGSKANEPDAYSRTIREQDSSE